MWVRVGRYGSTMILRFFVLIVWLQWPAQSIAGPYEIAGKVDRVIDGDSIVIAGQSIRLSGIDAPEIKQRCQGKSSSWACGVVSGQKLHELIKKDVVYCFVLGIDRYKRHLAECYIMDAAGMININEAMVVTGWAFVYRNRAGRVISSRYGAAEASARRMGVGFWDSEVMRPGEWRARKKR